MRVRCLLLFAALVALPDDSFAQRVTLMARTNTVEIASGLVSTQDTALVGGVIQASGLVVVAAGGTTTCDQSIPFPKQRDHGLDPGELTADGGVFQTAKLEFTPSAYPPLPENGSLSCVHSHMASAVQLPLFNTSLRISGFGVGIAINNPSNAETEQLSKAFTVTKPPFSAIASVDSCLHVPRS
jgi:hypothetical protein